MTKKIIFAAVAAVMVFATSCEKVNENNVVVEPNFNAKFEQTSDPYDYVFVNPKWELVNENYVDEFGNSGMYYVNINNPIEKKFEIINFSKECGDGGVAIVKGTLIN